MSNTSEKKELVPVKKNEEKYDKDFEDLLSWIKDYGPSFQSEDDEENAQPFIATKTSAFQPTQEVKQESNQTISKLTPIEETQNKDYIHRIWQRWVFMFFFFLLLGYQNWSSFSLVANSLNNHTTDSLNLVLSTLIGGTLTETYLVVKIMVQWVFSDNKYPDKKNIQ